MKMGISDAIQEKGAPMIIFWASLINARLDSVGDDEQRIGSKKRGHFGLVCLELIEGAPDRGVFVRRVLEFDHGERQAIDEQHDVRSARVPVLNDGELVDRQPVIGLQRVKSKSITRACAPRIPPSASRYFPIPLPRVSPPR